MIRAFTRHFRMLQPSIHSPGDKYLPVMGLVLAVVLTCVGASADADRGFRPTDQAPAGLDASRINPLAGEAK